MFVWVGKNNYVDISYIAGIRKYTTKDNNKRNYVLQVALSGGINNLSYIDAVYEDENMRDMAFMSLSTLIDKHQNEKLN